MAQRCYQHPEPDQTHRRCQVTKTIPLSRGYVATVDDEDFEWLNQWKWRVSGSSERGLLYAVYYFYEGKKKMCMRMHRVILGLSLKDTMQGDHINGKSLDNRRSNLRLATNKQNCRNLGLGKNNKSGYPGVHWDKSRSKWMAFIKVDYHRKHLGRFDDFEEAVAVRKEAELYDFGDFARRDLEPKLLHNPKKAKAK